MRLVWVVAPRTRAVTVYRLDAPPVRPGPDATPTGEPVLPALRIPVRRVFDGLAPAE